MSRCLGFVDTEGIPSATSRMGPRIDFAKTQEGSFDDQS